MSILAPHFSLLQAVSPEIEAIVAAALREDVGSGDVTTLAVVDPSRTAQAQLLAKAPGIICGLDVAREAFRQVDSRIVFEPRVVDGAVVAGTREVIATLDGPAAGILTGERVALNFLQRLSGVSSITARFVEAAGNPNVRLVDTRKTTPGLRNLEKYAVRVGGGGNHRQGLSDGVLIKDNHIIAAGGIAQAVALARKQAHHLLKIEVEAKELDQVKQALDAGADVIMLDNMTMAQLREAVAVVAGRALTEASGGVNLATIGEIASTGVDLISVGALTHSAPALDISLDFVFS
ncbi:MAG: carboxylating nicotinate-nucleotide diphosphorylase [Capsulimonadaceae bacterium]|nr:carboxylating nicotinate-nucleotide diphosphorylase [Capsulimonadaceae bacterium]